MAVNCSHFDYTKHLRGKFIILILKVSTFLFRDIVEKDGPYLLATIELEYGAKIQFDHV